MELAYGNASITLSPHIVEKCRILSPVPCRRLCDRAARIRFATHEFARRINRAGPRSVAILVEDKTRVNPEYPDLLAAMIPVLDAASVKDVRLVVMYGTHAPHSAREHERLYGPATIRRVHLVEHDCRNEKLLTPVGMLPSGHELKINSWVAESDFIAVMGSVAPHAFAGFTGGPKCIIPGVADYQSIRNNHGMVLSPTADLGVLEDNPIHMQMMAAVRLCRIDFAIQSCRDDAGNLVEICFGDLLSSYYQAVAICSEINGVTLNRRAGLVVASCGGAPFDATLYSAQRCLAVAAKTVKPHGCMIIVGEFPLGIGNRYLSGCLANPRRIARNIPPAEIEIGMHSALLMMRNMANARVRFYTSLDENSCREHHLERIDGERALNSIILDHSKNGADVYLLPHTANLLPRFCPESSRSCES